MGVLKIDAKKSKLDFRESTEKINPKILVILESKALKEKTIESLSGLNCQIEHYENFEKTAMALDQKDISLVIIDGDCNKPNSTEFLRKIYERKLRVPILMLVNKGRPKQKQEALRHGVFDFIQKPIDITDFEKTVRLAIENGRLDR